MGAIDADRFEAIFDAHGAAVLRYLLRRAERASAEDALSETFLIAWRRRAEMPAEPLPWLYAVARNVLANQRRVDGRRVALLGKLRRERPTSHIAASTDAGLVAEAVEAPSGDAQGRSDRHVDEGPLLAALRTLAPADQEVLMLDAWEELSSTDAGAVLGCSAEAYRARLSRAKSRLRRAAGDATAPSSSAPAAEATR